jgi:hypothetical protein
MRFRLGLLLACISARAVSADEAELRWALHGYSSMGQRDHVALADFGSGVPASAWVPVGATWHDVRVVSYDVAQEIAEIEEGGRRVRLKLRPLHTLPTTRDPFSSGVPSEFESEERLREEKESRWRGRGTL